MPTDVAASVQQAGELSNFHLSGFGGAVPILTAPIMIHLENALLGPQCYIGSNSEPIFLELKVLTPFTGFIGEDYEANGQPYNEDGPNPMLLLGTSGSTVGDQSFAVPGASGCGPRGSLDAVIDHAAGLPSPAGANALALNETVDVVTALKEPETVAPNDGRVLSQYWHAAVMSGPHGRH